MADIADRAAKEIEKFTQRAIDTYRRDEGNISHIGECHYCGEEVEPPKLYCSGDCATDHDKEINRF